MNVAFHPSTNIERNLSVVKVILGSKSCAKLAVKSDLKRCHMDVIRVFYI